VIHPAALLSAAAVSLPVGSLDLHIVVPLQEHPYQACTSYDNRPSKRLSPARRPKDEPFAREVSKGHDICPESQLVERRVIDVVRGIEPY
jgi:hypothetical protein